MQTGRRFRRGGLGPLPPLLLALWPAVAAGQGAVLVADLNRSGGPGFSPQPDSLVAVGSTLFFVQDDGGHGRELWRSDGTTSGTVLVRDVRPGVESSVAPGSGVLVAAGSHVYFVADDGEHGAELWTSDGSEAGTRLVADLTPGAAGTAPQSLTAAEGRVFFVTSAGNGQFDLWVSDGTTAGTVAVRRFDSEIVAGLPLFPFRGLAGVGSGLFIEFRAPGERMQLWRSDGTGPGTVLVKDFGAGTQFWSSSGTTGGSRASAGPSSSRSTTASTASSPGGATAPRRERPWSRTSTRARLRRFSSRLPSSAGRSTSRSGWSCGRRTERRRARPSSRTSAPSRANTRAA